MNQQRVVTFLNRDEVDYLDKLGKDALFSSGMKLSRAKIIAWLIDFIEELQLSGKDIKSEKDLENKILEGIKRSVPTSPVRNLEPKLGQISNGASHGPISGGVK